MTELFHATAKKNIGRIAEDGLKPGAYLTSDPDISDYYAETIRDEGEEPIIVKVELRHLDEEHISPDHPGIEEPITTVIGVPEDEIQAEWENSAQTWKDSLNIINSVRYDKTIPPHLLSIDDGNDFVAAKDFLSQTKRSSKKTNKP